LPDADRQTLDQYLGSNVIGEAIAIPSLTNGLNDLISLHDGLAWRMRVVSGNNSGAIEYGSAALLNRAGNSAFRFDTGDGPNVLFGQLDQKGNLLGSFSRASLLRETGTSAGRESPIFRRDRLLPSHLVH